MSSIARNQTAKPRCAGRSSDDCNGNGRGWVDLLHATEPMVATVERGHGQPERPVLITVSQLVRQLFFRMEVGTAGEEVGWFGGSKQLPVDARRRPQCPRHGHPERAGRPRPPAHTAAGLDLEAGVVVVLDLGADGYVDAVGNERDLV